ncbi:MAG: gamma-glutamylcyclotransferase family protein [Nitrospiria bacterium]
MIYFAYGSNMDLGQMQSRCPGTKVIGVGRLFHYSIAFTRWSRSWKSGTADILPEKGPTVYGALYDLSLEDLKKMDRFADYPNSYIRQDISVDCGGEQLPALTYIARRFGVFLPSQSYLGKMVRGAESHDIPQEYVDFLKSIKTLDE